MNKLKYIFVHGLSGWGSYDRIYRYMPYWGMRGGDLISFLRKKGYDCYAASVSPTGSAWDRACELYAQLRGEKTDYGAAHSQTFRHERFGRDFTGCPLIPSWEEDTRLVLLGHSFGGTTIRLLAGLLAKGDEKERQTGACSPLFLGIMEKHVFGIVTLASPINGASVFEVFSDPSYDPGQYGVSRRSRIYENILASQMRTKSDGRDEADYAMYDMHIDNALELNKRIPTLSSTYYLSVPCRITREMEDGTHVPMKGMSPMFDLRSRHIGAFTGTTEGGFVIDETWRMNDGLVNTVSAMAPLGVPTRILDLDRADDVKPGIWNVLPPVEGDHMYLQGGFMRRHDIRAFYLDLLRMIEKQA